MTPPFYFVCFLYLHFGTHIEFFLCVSQLEKIRGGHFCILNEWVQDMRELRIPTRKTNPIHNDVPENTTFLLLDQPSGEANTTGTLISKIDEVTINAKTANWKAIVMFLILQSINKRTIYHLIPLSVSAKKLYQPKIVIKCIIIK